LDCRFKILEQLIHRGKGVGLFGIAQMDMIAFAGFVIEAHQGLAGACPAMESVGVAMWGIRRWCGQTMNPLGNNNAIGQIVALVKYQGRTYALTDEKIYDSL
jgi:hypothetical protein